VVKQRSEIDKNINSAMGITMDNLCEELFTFMRLDCYKEVALEELPYYTNWAERIVNADCSLNVKRNNEKVLAEYDIDKWEKVLDLLQNTYFSNFSNATDLFFYVHLSIMKSSKLVNTLISFADDHIIDVETDENREKCQYRFRSFFIKKFKQDAEVLVELGSGVGRNMFALLQEFPQFSAAACGDLSPTGVKCTQIVSEYFNTKVDAYVHDHYDPNPSLMGKCKDALVFTCQTIEQLPKVPEKLIQSLILARPHMVVHFEPVYEHAFINNRLLNLLRRKYTQIKDYNIDLFTYLLDLEKSKEIRIVCNEPHVYGNNIFNPLSVIVWKPC